MRPGWRTSRELERTAARPVNFGNPSAEGLPPVTRAGRLRRVPVVSGVHRLLVIVVLLLLGGPWGCTNNPYPHRDAEAQILYRPFAEAPKTLDPAVAYTTTAHDITGLVNATLLEYHYLERPYTLIPGLAVAVPEAELDAGRVRYRFALRDDLLYQDDPCFAPFNAGETTRRVLAADVAFELMRIADAEVNSPAFEAFANVAGVSEFRARLQRLRADGEGQGELTSEQYRRAGGIEGVVVRSETELELVMASPYPQILYWFAMPFTAPMPWEAVAYYDGEEGRPHLADHPVGAGPYRVTRYDKQSRIALAQNPNWHGVRHPEWRAPGTVFPESIPPADREFIAPEARGAPLATIERIELRREKEGIPAFNKFLQGYYDASGIVEQSFDQVVQNDALSPAMAERGMSLRKTVEPGTFYLGFNMDDAVVGTAAAERGRQLRQAMSLAIDAEEFLRLFMNGRGIPAQSILPPGIFGHDEGYRNPYRQVDLDRARRLLAAAGYPDGIDPDTDKPLRLTFDTGDTSQRGKLIYTSFINSWRQIGVDVQLEATNYNRFQEKMRDGNFQVFIWGWVADYPDPENFMFLGWSKMSRTRNNGPNSANFAHPEYDALFLRMKTMANTAERAAIIGQMLALLERETPWIPLYHREQYALYHGWLHNVKPMGLSVPNAKYYTLDAAARARTRADWNRPVLWPAFLLAGVLAALLVPALITFYRERQ